MALWRCSEAFLFTFSRCAAQMVGLTVCTILDERNDDSVGVFFSCRSMARATLLVQFDIDSGAAAKCDTLNLSAVGWPANP